MTFCTYGTTSGIAADATSPVGEAGRGSQSGCAWRYDTTTWIARRHESELFGGGHQLAKSASIRLRVVVLVLVAHRYVLDVVDKWDFETAYSKQERNQRN